MKSILVATDLSERSDRAVRRALRLARSEGALCHVLHVVDEVLPVEMAGRLREDAQARLVRFVETNKGDARAEISVLVGDPMQAIPEQARRVDAELVVLGLHRRRAILDRLRETTMERLVRMMQVPVLLVKDTADHDYASALVPVSFSPACAAAVAAARQVAPGAEMSVFHAVYLPYQGLTGERPGGAMDQELTAEARSVEADWRVKEGLTGDDMEVDYVTGSLEDVLKRKLDTEQPDVMALGAHTRGPLATSVLGGFAADMIRNPPTDLLLAHP